MENQEPLPRTPGIVILAAIINFVSGGFVLMGTVLFSVIFFLFGQWWLWASRSSQAEIPEWVASLNAAGPLFALGIFLAGFFLMVLMAAIPLWTGVGLLQRKRFAWYAQVVQSVFGLFFFPLGTVINCAALILFFRPNIREHFGV